MATYLIGIRRLLVCGLAVVAVICVGVVPSASAQDIVVTSAEPPEAEQGTVNLDVTVNGSGFGKGARAAFLVTGTENPGGVIVNRTTFVNSKKLIANIDVAVDAVVSGFDIKVTLQGRTGKGIDLFAVKESSGDAHSGFWAGAEFRDAAGDGVTSDGYALPSNCGEVDYVDENDLCAPSILNTSHVGGSGGYFLRTVSNTEPLTVVRWLILRFNSEQGYGCPGLDTRLNQEIDDKIASDPRSDPLLRPPENPEDCIDYVEVRFNAAQAFAPGATTTTVGTLIDMPVRKMGKGKNAQPYTQWDARFTLDFVNPLTLGYGPSGEAIVGADGDDFRAELWTLNQKTLAKEEFIGIYTMPFRLTITNRE